MASGSVDLHEKANFTRISRLLVDKGTEALRSTFDTMHSRANLPVVLATNRTSLLKLKPRVINNSQWDLLFPPSGNPPDSKTFDVTLLTVLFRNICGLPTTGWGVMPLHTDRSIQANIVRIKSFRNEVYAHVTSTQVDNATFESLWKKISQALVELNISQHDVDDLKTSLLGPEEEIYVKMLEDWKLQEDECVKVLEDLNNEVKAIKEIVEDNWDGINQLRQRQINSDEDLLRRLAKHNFKGKIRRKVKFFHPGTRKWLFKQVDEFVENEHESRMLLLTAGPGFGKSVFAAKVCEDYKMKGKLAAFHFCDFSNSNLRDPMVMLQSLASQMCENVVGFKEKLLDQLKRPNKVQSLKDAFGIYLQNPLDELELHEPCLVVIDGLDESAADDKNEIMHLMVDYFPDLPECIKVLVTSRPEISMAKLSGVQTVDIKLHDSNNNSDLEIFLKARLPCLADRKVDMNDVTDFPLGICMQRDQIYWMLANKCEGSFLYAFHVQYELQKRDDLNTMTFREIVKFLPEGLDSIYQAYFKRLEAELKNIRHENLDVLRILEMLSVSKGSLPLAFVTRALGLVPDCRETKNIINKVNETISCLLYVSNDLVTVFHKSVIDWLISNDHEYTVKVSVANKSLWLICEEVFEEIKTTVSSGHDFNHENLTIDVKYALDHGLQHLVACDMKERFFWLVDVVIIHVLLTIDPRRNREYILNLWEKILQGAMVSQELRARISWHVVEMERLEQQLMIDYRTFHSINLPFYYLQSVLTHSPKGYFSDKEKKITEALLSKVRRFVELSFSEAEIIPLAIWHHPPTETVKAVGMSHKKTMAAVALKNGRISVLTVPNLVELWSYPTNYKRISICVFAPDDSLVLFGKLETALNIAERKELPFLRGIDETFTSGAFSPNGNRLVTCNNSCIVKLWDVARQNLMSLLYAEVPVNWCSFNSTGLFIIGDRKCNVKDSIREDTEYDEEDSQNGVDLDYDDDGGIINWENIYDNEDSFCVWNTITWQRSDERDLADELGLSHKKCKRCFRPECKEERWEIEPRMSPYKNWFEGIYNCSTCIFVLYDHSFKVVSDTCSARLFTGDIYENKLFIAAVVDDLLFYVDWKKLMVFRTLTATQEQSSCLPRPTLVLWNSFSPDGSRLATCTSDGCIRVWNVYTSQVEQGFQSTHGKPLFACCWSEKSLFVFEFFDGVPSLTRYLVDNLKIVFSQSQQVSLCHLVDEFAPLSAIVDFSEGFLSFQCGKEPVKVIDVNGDGRPRMVSLPWIKPLMNIRVSPGASFVFGSKYKFDKYFIWKRNVMEEPAVYELFFIAPREIYEEDFDDTLSPESNVDFVWNGFCSEHEYNKSYSEIEYNEGNSELEFNHLYSRQEGNYTCCFGNDCKVAVVMDTTDSRQFVVIDLNTGNCKIKVFNNSTSMRMWYSGSRFKLLCINKDRVVIVASDYVLEFFDMDSGALLSCSVQKNLEWDLRKQTKISPKDNVIAFPKVNGDMVFLRLCVPPEPSLSSIKREAAIPWENYIKKMEVEFRLEFGKYNGDKGHDGDDNGGAGYDV